MSVAVTDGDMLLAEVYVNNGLKHSSTLMGAVDYVMQQAAVRPEELDGVAVAAGPGSFTGIRIGVAAAEAIAYAAEIQLYSVSTLAALLLNTEPAKAACAAMDARRGEVYTKAVRNGREIVPEGALPLVELLEKLRDCGEVTFAGDAALKFRREIEEKLPGSRFLGEQFILQHASTVCRCVIAGKAIQEGRDGLKPRYLRESQAERLKKSGTGQRN